MTYLSIAAVFGVVMAALWQLIMACRIRLMAHSEMIRVKAMLEVEKKMQRGEWTQGEGLHDDVYKVLFIATTEEVPSGWKLIRTLSKPTTQKGKVSGYIDELKERNDNSVSLILEIINSWYLESFSKSKILFTFFIMPMFFAVVVWVLYHRGKASLSDAFQAVMNSDKLSSRADMPVYSLSQKIA